MLLSLRRVARSRCLRALGVLAWLMLVATSLAAAPSGMQAQDLTSMHATHAITVDHCGHDALADECATDMHAQIDCCGGDTAPGCHCAAMCASAVPATLTMIAPMPLSASYHVLAHTIAPSPNAAPPLRPPSR